MSVGKRDMWNYAIMTKDAKEQGGTERYIEAISADGIRRGRRQMIPVAVLVLAEMLKLLMVDDNIPAGAKLY